jgi:hypothetical protein
LGNLPFINLAEIRLPLLDEGDDTTLVLLHSPGGSSAHEQISYSFRGSGAAVKIAGRHFLFCCRHQIGDCTPGQIAIPSPTQNRSSQPRRCGGLDPRATKTGQYRLRRVRVPSEKLSGAKLDE